MVYSRKVEKTSSGDFWRWGWNYILVPEGLEVDSELSKLGIRSKAVYEMPR